MTITIDNYTCIHCCDPSDSNLQSEATPTQCYSSYAITGDYKESLPTFNRKINAFLKRYSRELERSGNTSPSPVIYNYGYGRNDQCGHRVFLVHFMADIPNYPVTTDYPLNVVEATEWLNNTDNEEFKCSTLVGRVLEFFTSEKCGDRYCMSCCRRR